MILFTQTVLQQARYNTPLFKSPKERKSNASPRGEHCSHLLSQTALLWFEQPDSSQASQQLIHSGFCLRFMWLHPHGELGIAQVGCHGCKTNLREMKKDLPWSAAQQAAYLCVVWTKCRKTSQRWMKTCSPGRLADRPTAGRGGEGKKAENSKAVTSVFIVFFPPLPSCSANFFFAVKFPDRQQSGLFKN